VPPAQGREILKKDKVWICKEISLIGFPGRQEALEIKKEDKSNDL
jgi:hypothetical protein